MANLTAVVMPKWGMEMTEGEVAEWHVSVGDEVAAEADIVDVETAKIVNTVSSNGSGRVVRLCAAAGDIVPVGGLLVVLADGAAGDDEIDAFVAARGGENDGVSSAVSSAASSAPETLTSSSDSDRIAKVKMAPVERTPETAAFNSHTNTLGDGPDDSAVAASKVARRIAAANGINLHNIDGTGRHGRVSLADLRSAASQAGMTLDVPQSRSFESPSPEDGSRLSATPVARRLASQLGISLHACNNTGRHGRIRKADVEAAAARLHKPVAETGPEKSGSTTDGTDTVSRKTLAGARRTIARRVAQAKLEVPHFRVNVDVEVTAAMSLRKTLNARRPGVKISLNDILIKACAAALGDNPGLNARFDGETLEHHSAAHISCAVAANSGVLMPVLRDAGKRGLGDISGAMRDLATRAKTGRLSLDEMDGGTFSISNLGMYGIDSFDAIINQPQVAILAVGTAQEAPIVRDGTLDCGLVMKMSLSSDHRVVDGADAARFLAQLKELVEQPSMMLG